MKPYLLSRTSVFVLLLLLLPHSALGQGTALTYQGHLNDQGSPANGLYDLRFSLWGALTGSSQVGGAITNRATAVTAGVFSATLDFGANAFDGAARWLEISVRTNGNGSFFKLSPRQPVTSIPYAIRAISSASFEGALPGNQLAGTYPAAVTLNNAANSFSGSFAGNGNALTDVNAATLGGLSAGAFWQSGGNAGTTAGTHFLGTRDPQPLELKVNALRALRLEDNGDGGDDDNEKLPDGAPNLIGGSPFNYVPPGVVGATISGGGATNYDGVTRTNAVYADFGVVGGGYENLVSQGSSAGTISGGFKNTLGMKSYYSTIGGGAFNTIDHDSQYCTIGGGAYNEIKPNSRRSTIAGGDGNEIRDSASGTVIGGGNNNLIYPYSFVSTIAGGRQNRIQDQALECFIGGGRSNVIATNAVCATIPGGHGNSATNYAFAAGRRAKADHSGSFVWGDSADADFASTANNQFLVRASGGVAINKNNPASALDVNGTATVGELISTGDAGVGTVNPETRLDVRGTATLQTAASGNNDNLALKKTGAVSGSNVRFVMSHRSGGTQVYLYSYDGTTYRNLQGWDHANNAVRFPANGDTLYVNQANARVGVKTATPAFDLHVNGTAGKPGGGSWSVASDERLKKNIHPLEGALERLLRLRGVKFEYKDAAAVHELAGERMGMIAQEVEAVFPDWVETGKDGMRRLTVRGFEALTVEAVRQLREEKDAEIAALKSEMSSLRQLVHSLAQSQKGAAK